MAKITTEQGNEWVAAFGTANKRLGLTAPSGQPINSFFLSRAEAEAILSNPSKTGIRIHLAKAPGSAPKEITLVFTGSTTVIAADALVAADTTGDPTYGNPPPCPTVCG